MTKSTTWEKCHFYIYPTLPYLTQLTGLKCTDMLQDTAIWFSWINVHFSIRKLMTPKQCFACHYQMEVNITIYEGK